MELFQKAVIAERSMAQTRFSISRIKIAALALAFLTSCESAEDRQIASAQDCIDSAKTAADADHCYGIVSGLESEKAYLIRCSANYIAQGFTGPRFASAFQRLKDNPNSGQDPMATAMAYLIFTNNSPTHSVDNAVNNCNRSGVRSMKRLVMMSKLATFVTSAGLGGIPANADPLSGTFDPATISNAITNLAGTGSPADKENVGNIAISMSEAYCNEGSSFENNEICKNLKTSINGGGGAQAIGEQLLAMLQQVNP